MTPRRVFVGFLLAIVAASGATYLAINKSDQAQQQGATATRAAKTANAKATSVQRQVVVVRHTNTRIIRTLAGKPGGLGPRGLRGIRGPRGPVGPPGAIGRAGKDARQLGVPDLVTALGVICDRRPCVGPPGKDGRDGAQGPTGKDGAPGAPGPAPQPFTFTFTDATGAGHSCTIDPNTGPAISQPCS